MTRPLRILGNVVFALGALAIGGVILGLTVLPPVLHYQTYVVLSGSMEPAIRTGSVIIATAVPPDALKVGDVISYIRPTDQENVTHRIVEIKLNSGGPTFVTKGDANGALDDGEIRYDRLAGKVQLVLPGLGYFFRFIGSANMRFLFIVAPGVLLLGSWLWEVWRPEPKGGPVAEEAKTGAGPASTANQSLPRSQTDIVQSLAADAAAVPLRQ